MSSDENRYTTDGESLSFIDPDKWNEENDSDDDEADKHPCFVPKEERD